MKPTRYLLHPLIQVNVRFEEQHGFVALQLASTRFYLVFECVVKHWQTIVSASIFDIQYRLRL